MADEITPKFTLTKKRNTPTAAPLTPTVVNPDTGGIRFLDLSIPDNVERAPKVRYEAPPPRAQRAYVPPVVEPARPFPNTPHATVPHYIEGKKNSSDFGPTGDSQDLTQLVLQNLEKENPKQKLGSWGIDATTGLLIAAAIGGIMIAASKSKSQNKIDSIPTEYYFK